MSLPLPYRRSPSANVALVLPDRRCLSPSPSHARQPPSVDFTVYTHSGIRHGGNRRDHLPAARTLERIPRRGGGSNVSAPNPVPLRRAPLVATAGRRPVGSITRAPALMTEPTVPFYSAGGLQ